jgi:ArsR family transcriptional regulator, arsenate/arsenite/antimonite-responsive transcriptional repressor
VSAAEVCDCAAPVEVRPVSDPSVDAATDSVFKALASAPRRQLLAIIAANTSADGDCCATEVCACKLADALDLAPSTISHHMSALVKAGLVSATRRGLWVYYRLEREALARIAEGLVSL